MATLPLEMPTSWTTSPRAADALEKALAVPLAEGRVKLTLLTPQGRELILRHAEAGDTLGEFALVDGDPRSADATAVVPTAGWVLERARFAALTEAHPALGMAAARYFCRRLRDTTDPIEAEGIARARRRAVAALGARGSARAQPLRISPARRGRPREPLAEVRTQSTLNEENRMDHPTHDALRRRLLAVRHGRTRGIETTEQQVPAQGDQLRVPGVGAVATCGQRLRGVFQPLWRGGEIAQGQRHLRFGHQAAGAGQRLARTEAARGPAQQLACARIVAELGHGDAAQGKRLATQTVGGRGSITTLDGTRPVLNLQVVEGKVRLAFPARVYQAPTGVGTPPPVRGYQGALRLEVNTTTGALAQRSMVVSTPILNGDTPGLYSRFDIANERSLQVDNLAYQLSGGQVFTKAGD